MKKNYMLPMTGVNEMSVSQVLCASNNTLQFATDIPAGDATAD